MAATAPSFHPNRLPADQPWRLRRYAAVLLALTLIQAACSSVPPSSRPDPDSPQLPCDGSRDSVEERARTMLPEAELFDSQRHSTVPEAWRITLRTPSRARVQVDLAAEGCAIIEAEGDEDPFDYDFIPRQGFIRLQEAQLVARNFRPGTWLSWRLHQRPDLGDIWVYAFVHRIGDAAVDIVINANTGEVLDLR